MWKTIKLSKVFVNLSEIKEIKSNQMLKNNKQTDKNNNKTHINKTNNNNKNPFLQIGCKNGFEASQLDVFCS